MRKLLSNYGFQDLALSILLAIILLVLAFTLLPGAEAQSTRRSFVVLGSTQRITTTISPDINNYSENLNVTGGYVIVNVSGVSTTTLAITPSIQIKDPVSGEYRSILTASMNLAAVGTRVYLVYPGVGAAGADVTQVVAYPLPYAWRVRVEHWNSNPITYSVSALLVD